MGSHKYGRDTSLPASCPISVFFRKYKNRWNKYRNTNGTRWEFFRLFSSLLVGDAGGWLWLTVASICYSVSSASGTVQLSDIVLPRIQSVRRQPANPAYQMQGHKFIRCRTCWITWYGKYARLIDFLFIHDGIRRLGTLTNSKSTPTNTSGLFHSFPTSCSPLAPASLLLMYGSIRPLLSSLLRPEFHSC